MRHGLLGGSGLRVSNLCLGTLTFGENKDWGCDRAEATAILGRFADAGGSFIDTAPNYGGGAAEEIVGGFIRERRDQFVVATKFTASPDRHPLAGGNSRKSLIRSVEASLRRLGTDHLDLMWLHYWDGTTPLDEILRALDDLVSAGKLLYIGLSDTPAWLVSRAATMAELRGWSRVVAIQAEYNVVARDAERELLPMAEALDLGIVCWGPLAAGALAGAAERRRRAILPEPIAAIVSQMAALAQERGTTPAALALAWVGQGGRRIPIIGARTADQLDTNLTAADWVPDEPSMATLGTFNPPVLGFPHDLIASPYLRRLALGDAARIAIPARPRA